MQCCAVWISSVLSFWHCHFEQIFWLWEYDEDYSSGQISCDT